MNTIFKIGILIALFIAVVAFIFFGFSFLNIQNRAAENEARYQCALSVRYQVTQGDTTISYPPEDLYQKCLEEKGL